MFPSGGAITLVDQPMTWSPESSVFSCGSGKRHVVGGVARREHAFDPPVAALDDVAVVDLHIGNEIRVAAGVEAHVAARSGGAGWSGAVRPVGIGRGPGQRLEPGRQGRVIVVGMGDQDVADRFAVERSDKGVEMRFVERPRVDHGHVSPADDVGACAGEGEGARVVGDHSPQQGRDLGDLAILEVDFAFERNVAAHALPSRFGRRSI